MGDKVKIKRRYFNALGFSPEYKECTFTVAGFEICGYKDFYVRYLLKMDKAPNCLSLKQEHIEKANKIKMDI